MGFHELCAIGRSMSRVLPASLGLLCVSDGLSVWTRRGAAPSRCPYDSFFSDQWVRANQRIHGPFSAAHYGDFQRVLCILQCVPCILMEHATRGAHQMMGLDV